MSTQGLLVRMHVKHDKERAMEDLLHSTLQSVQDEAGTIAWFAVRFGRNEYGIFDVFADDEARDAHLSGAAAALKQRASDLLESPPRIECVEVLADKLPVVSTEIDTKGLFLTFRAKAGRERDVEQFLMESRELVANERRTTAWFAIRTERGEYGIFDVFPRNEDRFFHLVGQVPRELAKHALALLGSMPEIEMVNVHAEKIGSVARSAVRH